MKKKILDELKSVFMTTLYFFLWFGALMIIKILLLREYQIEFYGFSMVLIGALVLAKVVLILEHVQISIAKGQPAIVDLIFRTVFYSVGVLVILLLEKVFEARHENEGLANTISHVFQNVNVYHFWVNSIVVFGALFFFNLWSLVKKDLGESFLYHLLFSTDPVQKIGSSEKAVKSD